MREETKNLIKFKRYANKFFQERDYKNALKFYSLAKTIKPEDKDVEVGILLCSLAFDMEDEAHAIYEFFGAAKAIDKSNSYPMVKSLIDSVEAGLESMLDDSFSIELEENAESQDGISYEDFKDIIKNNSDNFKEIFKKVIFSTKVVITKKEDFFEFVEHLIENGYIDMALSYIDSANTIFPSDDRIRDLLNLINRIEQIEISDK